MTEKQCERCGKKVNNLITCKPCFEAPPLDVCEDCSEILTRYDDYYLEDDEI